MQALEGEPVGPRGFTTCGVVVGQQVTFVRKNLSATVPEASAYADWSLATTGLRGPGFTVLPAADIELVGCVKEKLAQAAPAKDLHVVPPESAISLGPCLRPA